MEYFLGGAPGNHPVSGNGRMLAVVNARFVACKLIGELSVYIVKPLPGTDPNTPIQQYCNLLMTYLDSRSSLQRCVCGIILIEWRKADPTVTLPQILCDKLVNCLIENIYYDEIAMAFTKLQDECRDFVSTLRHYNILPQEMNDVSGVFSLHSMQTLCEKSEQTILSSKLRAKVIDTLDARRRHIMSTSNTTQEEQANLQIRLVYLRKEALEYVNCLLLPPFQ